jgi:hypothetical protein
MPCSGLWGRILVIQAPAFPIRSIYAKEKRGVFHRYMLAAAGVNFGTEIWEEVEGTSMWVGRGGCSNQELILRVMEGAARQEGYWAERPVGWNVKPRPRHTELPSRSGVSLQVPRSLWARSYFGIKICCEGTQVPPWCTFTQLFQPTILHCK